MNNKQCYSITLMVCICAVKLAAVTVNPALCPTNKIAPHRRVASWAGTSARTLGVFYDLLSPDNQLAGAPPSSLQEEPQRDDPEDCGDIEDYDENDVGSMSGPSQRRQGLGYGDSRLFFGGAPHGQRPAQGQRPGAPPARPQRPGSGAPPTRPPYWSGGYFGSNPYRPPSQQYPSDEIKPVHEPGYQESPTTYRPNVVGGPLGHVVGVSPARPTTNPSQATTQRAPSYVRFPHPQARPEGYPTRRPRPRNLFNNDSVLGSFIDLLFK